MIDLTLKSLIVVLFTVLELLAVRAGRNFRMSLVWICPSCVPWAVSRNRLENQLYSQRPVGNGGGGREN